MREPARRRVDFFMLQWEWPVSHGEVISNFLFVITLVDRRVP